MRHTLIFGPRTLSRMRLMGLRVSVSTALTLSAAVFAHFYPGEAEPTAAALNRPATVNAALSFDFSDIAPDRAPSPVAVTAEAEAAVPLPPARPRATAPSGGKMGNVAATLPKGVERFDRCQTACDSRDPVILASWTPAAAPAPVAARPTVTPNVLLPPAPMSPPQPPKTGMFEGAVDGVLALAGSGKRMIDGAVSSAGSTLTTVKSAVFGAIAPGN